MRRKKMTAIAAMIDKQTGRAYMAFESVVYWNNKVISNMSPKGVVRYPFSDHPKFLLGVSGSCRVSDLVLHEFGIPKFNYPGSEMRYMISEFVPALHLTLERGHALGSEKSVSEQPGHVIVAFHGHLFVIMNDFSVIEPGDKYYASGSGEEYCLGAIHGFLSHKNSDIGTGEILEIAVRTACFFDPGCKEPVTVICDR
jgi:hypothetical protein